MAKAKITSKGQITLPREVRDFLGLETGDSIDFIIRENQEVVVRPRTMDLKTLKGCLTYSGKPISVDIMNQAVRKAMQAKISK